MQQVMEEVSQSNELNSLKNQIKKLASENKEMEDNRKSLTQFLEEVLSENRKIRNENLRLKNEFREREKIIETLIESSSYWRDQSNQLIVDMPRITSSYFYGNMSMRKERPSYLKVIKKTE